MRIIRMQSMKNSYIEEHQVSFQNFSDIVIDVSFI